MGTFHDDDLPRSVLFICNLNAVRSPMAEALMKHYAGSQINVASCGMRQGELNPFAVAVMDEIGIDLSAHRPRSVEAMDEEEVYDMIISLTPEAQHTAVDLTHTMEADVVYWPTFDPLLVEGNREQVLDAFRSVRDALHEKIEKFLGLEPAPNA